MNNQRLTKQESMLLGLLYFCSLYNSGGGSRLYRLMGKTMYALERRGIDWPTLPLRRSAKQTYDYLVKTYGNKGE